MNVTDGVVILHWVVNEEGEMGKLEKNKGSRTYESSNVSVGNSIAIIVQDLFPTITDGGPTPAQILHRKI